MSKEKDALEVQVQQATAALDRQLEVMALQEESLAEMNERAAIVEAQMQDYLKSFKDQDLTRLARAKPGMIESRANKRTDEIFTVIENDTRTTEEQPTP